jgi:tetratricopeptide (TPR) repeat protein
VAVIGLQHGHSIRWGRWKHDAQLRDGGRLRSWLTENGIEAELLEFVYHNHEPFGHTRLRRDSMTPLSRAEQRVLVAEIRRRKGALDDALALCDDVLANDPEVGLAYSVRGMIRFQSGEFGLCVDDVTEAILHGCRHAELYYIRAVSHDDLGRPMDALLDCSAAIQIDPKCVNAYNSRGLIRMKVGQFDAALDDLEVAIKLAPDWELPYLNKAQLAHIQSDLESAIVNYSRVIDLLSKQARNQKDSMLAKVYWNRSRVHLAQGHKKQSEADAREAILRDPSLNSQS